MTDTSDRVTPPLQSFAADLRSLRVRAGTPSFRQMARRAHFSSSTLAEATQGRRLPTLPVVEGFARACGADPTEWAARWRAAASAVAAVPEVPPAGSDGGGPTPDPVPPGPERARPPAAEGRAGHRRWRSRPAVLRLAAVASVAALAGATAEWAVNGGRGDPAPRVPAAAAAPLVMPHDGADPADSGCGGDATVAARSPLTGAGTTIGTLELRYSTRCQAGWARFYLEPTAEAAMVEVRLEAQDGRAAAYTQLASVNVPVYTDLLHPTGGCLRALVVLRAGAQALTATTPCLTLHG